jgi:hypothetical protein
MAWGTEPAGTYSTGGVAPSLEGRAYLHIGLFKDTLSPFLQETGKDSFLAFANVDCNLYSSTLDVLEAMHGRIVPGTILIFDEYMAHPSCKFASSSFGMNMLEMLVLHVLLTGDHLLSICLSVPMQYRAIR